MCGRFALRRVVETISDQFEVLDDEVVLHLTDNCDIRPTTSIGTIISDSGDRHVVPMRWGFIPHWYERPGSGPLLINARSETIADKPAFRDACRARRCLIPMSGFYEWQVAGPRAKRVHWLEPKVGGIGAFAGIWQNWTAADGSTRATCAIVTCAAPEGLSHIHARLPIALDPPAYAKWLGEDGHGAAQLMRAPADGWWHVEPDRGPPVEGRLI